MRVSRKQAPRRTVVNVERVGTYGRVEYVHTLDCGHSESRKRVAPSTLMACTACVLAEEYENRARSENVPQMYDTWDDPWDPSGSQIASMENDTAQIRASLAAKFGVPPEAVDVAVGDLDGTIVVQYAVIMLSADEVAGHLGGRVAL
jgi:hypothetical protein